MNIQSILAYLLVASAVVYLLRKFQKKASEKECAKGCGGGCAAQSVNKPD